MNSLPALLPSGWNSYAGLAVAFAPMIASFFGYAPTPEFNGQLESTVLAWITALGGLYALYGKARHDLPKWFRKV